MKTSAGQFKSKCLNIIDQINITHEEVIITKHNKAVAKLKAISKKPNKSVFGFLKGSAKVNDDITTSMSEEWEAER